MFTLGLTLVASAYLIGSVSPGLMLAKRAGIDLRAVGSGNIGATNVGRALGKGTGRLVLALDALKGWLPVMLARALDADATTVTFVGLAAVLGHLLPIWHRFRGGKGAATSLGVMLAASPLVGAAAGIAYLLGKQLSKRASIGSLAGATAALAFAWVLPQEHVVRTLVTALWALVVVAHRSNIRRLLAGTEPRSE